jgi:hypothetical protein
MKAGELEQSRRVGLRDIEMPPMLRPRECAAVIRNNTLGLARNILSNATKEMLWKFAVDRMVDANDPRTNFILFISSLKEDSDEDRVFETDLALIRSILNPRIVAIASEYFHELAGVRDFILPYHALNCRFFTAHAHTSDPDALLPFHQDAIGFPAYYKVLNCWTLLYPHECGTTSPGLDFAAVAPAIFFEREANPASKNFFFLETKHQLIEEIVSKCAPLTPSVRHGDLLIFNELALHRTSGRLGLSNSRASAEIRLVAATEQVLSEAKDAKIAYAYVYRNRDMFIRWASEWAQSKAGNANWLEPGQYRPLKEVDRPLWNGNGVFAGARTRAKAASEAVRRTVYSLTRSIARTRAI